MATLIGYQDGITAEYNRLRDLDPGGTKLKKSGGKWPSLDTLTIPVDQWGAWDKAERRARIEKDDHDAAVQASPAPQPPPDGGGGTPPPVATLAPQTYNRGGSGQDARYCTTGLPKDGAHFVDAGGYRYDDGGRCLGGRSGNPVAGLKPADQMDGREPCDPYNGMPPWPAGSYEL